MMKFIEPYNPDWKNGFDQIKAVIEREAGGLSGQIDIQHIGSTSIPGLYAKPVLDIDIIIHNKELLERVSILLEKLGYRSKGEQGIAGRFAFRQTSVNTPLTNQKKKWYAHHLYVCYADSLALKNHLLFRDALLANVDIREKYSTLKKSMAANLQITREEYTTGKTDFIISVLAAAGMDEQELKDIKAANT